jgi:lipopolysaccharide/colanic/teichoic acid biosynthesis glycosyltransferase
MIKRCFDVVLAGAGLIGSGPLWLIIAAAIKLQDGGPVFFRQERVGLNGRIFRPLKFRSMVPDAEAASGPVQANEDDARITRIGRILRATAMDELPQLWSIFRGDMTFVGPRPLRPGEIEVSGRGVVVRLDEIAGYEARHKIKPGLTGFAQVAAPRDIPNAEKFRLDLEYAARAGFWLDMKLILISLRMSARGEWERRDRRLSVMRRGGSL